MSDEPQPLPAVLRSLILQLPPELRGAIEAQLEAVETHLERLGPGLAVVEAGLEAAAPFLAVEEAETRAAVAAAAFATESAARADDEVRVLATTLEDALAAEASRWADAVAMLVTMGDDVAVDLDHLARVLDVDEVAATDEAFDAFMLDDDAPLVLGPRRSRDGGAHAAPRPDRVARRLEGDAPIDLAVHASRLTMPGVLAESPAGLWRADDEGAAMLLGDGTLLRLREGVLTRGPAHGEDGNAAPTTLRARRRVGGAPPLLMPNAAAGLANATACRDGGVDVAPGELPTLLGLGAAIELSGPPEADISTVVEHLKTIRQARKDPAATASALLTLARDLYRVRAWLEPVLEAPASLPAIHVGQIRWCTLTARPICWMPVFAGALPTVGGTDRPWTTDPPSPDAAWQAVSPAVYLDPEWVAPLIVVPGDPNVWSIDPDNGWWSLDVDYDAIVLARRAHCEPWLRAVEDLCEGVAKDAGALQKLDGPAPVENELRGPVSESRLVSDTKASQNRPGGLDQH